MTILEAEPKLANLRRTRAAEAALVLATLVWGLSFTWAKAGGAAVNEQAGTGAGGLLGPQLLGAARFLGAAVLWIIVFPRARRGWSAASCARGLTLGLLMAAGMITQILGLDRTTEAVSAFLTSLTILWVPAIMTLLMRRPPAGFFWAGVAMASAGVWLMTGAMPTGFGAGEVLGLVCSVVFSFQIIALNVLVPRDDPYRMVAAEFVVTGAACLIGALLSSGGTAALSPGGLAGIFADREVWLNALLLILLPTLVSFGLQACYQPKVDPTRATLIYMSEPVFAAGYAWVLVGRRLGLTEMLGAGLILAANAVVEVLNARRVRQ